MMDKGESPLFSVALEQAVLGACLMTPDYIRDVQAHLDDVQFYQERHRRLFGRLVAWLDAGKKPELIGLAESFRADDYEPLGLAYLSALLDSAPVGSPVDLAKMLAAYARKRYMLQTLEEQRENLLAPGVVDLTEIQAAVAQVDTAEIDDSILWGLDFVKAGWTMLDPPEGSTVGQPLPTPWADLNNALGGGLGRSHLTIIAARPSMGKTALACNLFAYWGKHNHAPLMISMEMTAGEIAKRCLQAEGRVDIEALLRGYAENAGDLEGKWSRLAKTAEVMQHWNWGCYEKNAVVERICAVIRKAVRLYGVQAVIVDYAQLMRKTAKAADNDAGRIGHIARELKDVAKELNINVVLLSQLNRGCELRADKRPMMADIKGSGGIEEAADDIFALYRPVYYAAKEYNAGKEANDSAVDEFHEMFDAIRHDAELLCLKRRSGPGAGRMIPLRFFRDEQRFAGAY